MAFFQDHLGKLAPERHNQGKTNLDLLEQQEIVNGSGNSWAICKSAPRPRQITTQAQMPFHGLPTTQPTALKH